MLRSAEKYFQIWDWFLARNMDLLDSIPSPYVVFFPEWELVYMDELFHSNCMNLRTQCRNQKTQDKLQTLQMGFIGRQLDHHINCPLDNRLYCGLTICQLNYKIEVCFRSRNIKNPVQSYMVDLLLRWTLKTKTSLETQWIEIFIHGNELILKKLELNLRVNHIDITP